MISNGSAEFAQVAEPFSDRVSKPAVQRADVSPDVASSLSIQPGQPRIFGDPAATAA